MTGSSGRTAHDSELDEELGERKGPGANRSAVPPNQTQPGSPVATARCQERRAELERRLHGALVASQRGGAKPLVALLLLATPGQEVALPGTWAERCGPTGVFFSGLV